VREHKATYVTLNKHKITPSIRARSRLNPSKPSLLTRTFPTVKKKIEPIDERKQKKPY
jgi:hypothetical protein